MITGADGSDAGLRQRRDMWHFVPSLFASSVASGVLKQQPEREIDNEGCCHAVCPSDRSTRAIQPRVARAHLFSFLHPRAACASAGERATYKATSRRGPGTGGKSLRCRVLSFGTCKAWASPQLHGRCHPARRPACLHAIGDGAWPAHSLLRRPSAQRRFTPSCSLWQPHPSLRGRAGRDLGNVDPPSRVGR